MENTKHPVKIFSRHRSVNNLPDFLGKFVQRTKIYIYYIFISITFK